MLRLHVSTLIACVGAMAALFVLYSVIGVAKPMPDWHWVDVAGEGGTAIMSGVWMMFLLSARPRGRVTALLGYGLAAIMVAAWADCLDEFYRVDKDALWDNVIEGVLMPAGVALVTAGLYAWREEQRSLTRQLARRERLFRDHRAFDRVTELADAGYLAQQIRLEQARQPDAYCAVLLFDIDRFHAINRTHGQHEGDRVLHAVTEVLLLNLRHADLLCRYAGDRFAVLMPNTDAAHAQRAAVQLARAVESLCHHAERDDRVIPLTVRNVWAVSDGDADRLLRSLNHAIDRVAATDAPQLASAGR